MAGPCSLPKGSRAEWLTMNEVICNLHDGCTPSSPKMVGMAELRHEFMTRRVWLMQRNRLRTGKTL